MTRSVIHTLTRLPDVLDTIVNSHLGGKEISPRASINNYSMVLLLVEKLAMPSSRY